MIYKNDDNKILKDSKKTKLPIRQSTMLFVINNMIKYEVLYKNMNIKIVISKYT